MLGGIAKAFGLDDGPTHSKTAIVKGEPLAMPPGDGIPEDQLLMRVVLAKQGSVRSLFT